MSVQPNQSTRRVAGIDPITIDANTDDSNNPTFSEKFKNHISKNRGKYGAALGATVPLAGIKLGSNGYLGTYAQDTIQNAAGNTVRALDASAHYDKVKGNIDAGIAVYKKGDNLLYNPAEENQKLLIADRILQQENVPYLAKTGASKFVKMLTDVDKDPDKMNYIIRNPLKELNYQKDLTSYTIGAAKDSVVDAATN